MKVVKWSVIALSLFLLFYGILLWIWQNADQVALLSFDTGSLFGQAWEMQEPMAVPLLMLISFGVGIVCTMLPLFLVIARLKSHVRTLERSSAFASTDPLSP